MNLPIIMCSIVGAIILKNGIEFSIHKPEQNIVTFEECQHFLQLYCIDGRSQIASKRYSNIIVTLAQTLDKRLPLTLVER